MIAEPRWKTLAVQFLIWSSLLPFHKDTRVLPWLQTCLCYSDCLGFHRKDGRIEPFHRAQIIKHHFSLICLKNVLRLKLTTVLYLLGGIIALSRGHWGKPVEVLHLTGVPLDGQPLPCSKETGREKERGRGDDGGQQTERAHLPAESLQDTSAAAPLGVLEWLCGQSAANKDALISANSSCLIHSNSSH